ncbi:MAG TPA: YbaK/EbsC family protein [Bryobacteraceae bacterium]|nr:YbaK/EbsC family protein [Bryobacteraceae bacterium]
MATLDRCIDYLNLHGVCFSHSTHPAAVTRSEIASAERMPAHSLVKALVYVSDAGLGMAVVPLDRSVDWKQVLYLLGLSKIRLAESAELAELYPGGAVGAMPPFGNMLGLPVLVDSEVASQPILVFHAGTYRDVIRVAFADFRRLVNPLIASFSTAQETAYALGGPAGHARRTVMCRRKAHPDRV